MSDLTTLGVALGPAEMGRCLAAGVGYRVDARTGCWLWEAPASTGFGPFRAAWEATHGPVPPGLEPFHRCRGGQRGCVRPDHLDIGPPGQRVERVRDPALPIAERTAFARRVTDEREARGQTRAQFARALGVGAPTIAAWEEGRSAPTVDQVERMAREFGWDGAPRRWTVVAAVERVVTATSAGGAARQVRDTLNVEGYIDKVVIGRVHEVA